MVSLRAAAGDPTLPPRVSFAVGRRAGNAVTRNRIRRRLRAAISRSQDRLVAGGAYLFGAGATAATVPFDRLVASVRAVLEQAEEHVK